MNYNFSLLTKVIKVDERYYGYDAASKLLCELDEASAQYLSSGNTIVAPEPLRRLLEKGVFSTPSFQQCTVGATNIPTMVQYNMEHILPKRFTLEVTESCNLRCKYCFNTIGNRTRVYTQRHMDEDTAFMAIDYYFKLYGFTEAVTGKLMKNTDAGWVEVGAVTIEHPYVYEDLSVAGIYKIVLTDEGRETESGEFRVKERNPA